jgi:glutamate-ammonia-ligase adenylyltransferase
VDEYERYYREEALIWERQVLTRARPVAGDRQTGDAYIDAVHRVIYSAPLSRERVEEVRAMKRRIETERLKAGDRARDLKLGYGGLSDIEFTAQLWQLRVGSDHPEVRTGSTADALGALGECGALPGPDAARLAAAHGLLTAVRNRLTLWGGVATDHLPDDERRLHALAVGLGETGGSDAGPGEAIRRSVTACMAETRSIVDRLFYGS